jgi:hypothetical protein
MGQLDFFDLSRRYECLDAKNDPLVAIAALVPWECFRPKLRAVLINGELRTSEAPRARRTRLRRSKELHGSRDRPHHRHCSRARFAREARSE